MFGKLLFAIAWQAGSTAVHAWADEKKAREALLPGRIAACKLRSDLFHTACF